MRVAQLRPGLQAWVRAGRRRQRRWRQCDGAISAGPLDFEWTNASLRMMWLVRESLQAVQAAASHWAERRHEPCRLYGGPSCAIGGQAIRAMMRWANRSELEFPPPAWHRLPPR